MDNLSKANTCPSCSKSPQTDIAHRKTCVNFDCDNYGITYLHHEWLESHNEISVENEVNSLMVEF